mmetsp:Transcript_1254/g.3066  ORF Transcript_1254/g.3066 Transcript_1254/m.3066 type:complete len:825 (+) Transcript_1254:617-3091(+)|eukprot:CAMPEP_0171496738 /NCGR_PEP_ID=MMETSP0958-20121227/6874_1 /TAXON_ID=87120 /ORGANISM="Aurantiochytrium limacinum, Strain ATCCMYA-1381" /LENGTH=824 /DNA_ID=CAMNT_0012030885 /DNA_START=615 /DNA_END=3089 /DNA_ORIENTATION=+
MGAPIFAFQLLRAVLKVANVETWLLSPLLLIGVLMIIGAIFAGSVGGRLILIIIALACLGSFLYLYLRVRTFPEIPDDDDVDRVLKDDPAAYPKAPAQLRRGELLCDGNKWFRDRYGRRVIPRGVNLAGGSKMPTHPLGFTHLTKGFFDWEHVTFRDRPFPLSEGREHLARLRCWGYTFLRFLVTWEAVEHAGPGKYDEDYLSYLRDVISLCDEFNISVFIDFHQDVWSRWTGGDGAPAWTLLKCGFHLEKLDASAAATTKQSFGGAKYPKMLWNSNHQRLGPGTMWTLFFAGNDFAPKTMVDGEPVQEYLQSRFAAAVAKVAETLKDARNVVGFDILNEPSNGYVGIKDATDISDNAFYMGARVAPWDAMRLGAGMTLDVPYFKSFLMYAGTRKLNKHNACAWTEGPASCVWYQNGVWEMDSNGEPTLLKKDYFAVNPKTGEPIDFLADYAIPFWKRVAKSIREHIPDAIIFAEPVLDLADFGQVDAPKLSDEDVGAGYVWAKHWYDGITLMSKHFSRYFGLDSLRMIPLLGLERIYAGHGNSMKELAKESSELGSRGSPVLIGEVGVPFDMKEGESIRKNELGEITCAWNASLRALEHSTLAFTLWNYSPQNTHEHGDNWNGEDLSIFSLDHIHDPEDLHSGGRALHAVIRPYPFLVPGDPIKCRFDPYSRDRHFYFSFKGDPLLAVNEVVLFVPKYHYPRGVDVYVSDGTYGIDWEKQTLYWRYNQDSSQKHWITLRKVLPPQPKSQDSATSFDLEQAAMQEECGDSSEDDKKKEIEMKEQNASGNRSTRVRSSSSESQDADSALKVVQSFDLESQTSLRK